MRHSARTRLRIAISVVAAAALCAPVAQAGTRNPTITPTGAGTTALVGLQDDRLAFATDVPARMKLLADAGASVVRVDVRWDGVAKTKPGSPRNANDPAYDWRQYDAIVSGAKANNLQLLFAVYGTPGWAADTTVPVGTRFPAASVRPKDPADYGAFAEAVARRYAPQGVTKWEGWNEANISLFLRPQYERRGGDWVPVSIETYSNLQKAFYGAVKSVDPTATVAGGVTAPAGESCPCNVEPVRVAPDDFLRGLDAPGLRPPMDVVSHHPYPLRAPSDSTPPGRSYVDLYNLRQLETTIDDTYLRGKKLWLTEYGFATEIVPEYNIYFSRAQQATFIVDAFRRFQRNPRIALTTYYLLQDHAAWKSGLLRDDGRAKPGFTAFTLPLTVMGKERVVAGAAAVVRGQVRNASRSVTVAIQWKVGPRWVRIGRITTSRDGSFRFVIRPRATIRLRAQWSGKTRSGLSTVRTSPAIRVRVG